MRPPVAANCRLDRGVTGDTFACVKTISIKELHARTGYWTGVAKKTPLIVTNRGEKVASLQPLPESAAPRPTFKGRDWSKLPKIDFDSTEMISADRDAR